MGIMSFSKFDLIIGMVSSGNYGAIPVKPRVGRASSGTYKDWDGG